MKFRNSKREEGIVLILVLLMVMASIGLGIHAMRHTSFELRSTGMYVDGLQAVMVAEASIAMLATDIRMNWDREGPNAWNISRWTNELGWVYGNCTGCPAWLSYRTQFLDFDVSNLTGADAGLSTIYSPLFDNNIHAAGIVPDEHFNGENVGTTLPNPLALTSVLSMPTAQVQMNQGMPVLVNPKGGFSNENDESRNFDWYCFSSHATADYGSRGWTQNRKFARGRAEARSRMIIGPVLSF